MTEAQATTLRDLLSRVWLVCRACRDTPLPVPSNLESAIFELVKVYDRYQEARNELV